LTGNSNYPKIGGYSHSLRCHDPSHPFALRHTALGTAACGISLGNLFEERPAHALDRFTSTSDAWVDSAGGLRGSFVGEGTSHAVHLISTDTGLIADLVRRYRPDIIHGDFWTSLSAAGTVVLDPVAMQSQNNDYEPLVGSPEGHVEVQLTGVLARGSRCGWRGAQAELIVVSPPKDTDVPGLRGPVVGSFRLKGEVGKRQLRHAPPVPGNPLIATLLDRTRHAMDSMLDHRLYQRDRPLTRPAIDDIPINSLLDVDAADIVPLRATNGKARYAVSLRERRITASGDTTLAAIVMVWDSAGLVATDRPRTHPAPDAARADDSLRRRLDRRVLAPAAGGERLRVPQGLSLDGAGGSPGWQRVVGNPGSIGQRRGRSSGDAGTLYSVTSDK
jgi:hypothetical protein